MLTIQLLSNFLLWCTALNYCVLMLWFLAFMLAHDWMLRVHTTWFRLSVERFDTVHYALMGVYKVGVIVFNLVPYLALRMLT